jgi:hypothetical protein
MLKKLIQGFDIETDIFKADLFKEYGYQVTDETIESCVRNLNFQFVKENYNKKRTAIGDIHQFSVVKVNGKTISLTREFKEQLRNSEFKKYLVDSTDYAITSFKDGFSLQNFKSGFTLYKKYSRKDVFRILNWQENPLAQNVGGYIISKDKSNCPIFVNYHKSDDISDTTKYEDKFLSEVKFHWMSKSKRKLDSPDVQAIANYKSGLRLPLFIKKSNDEGTEFFYMGDVEPNIDSFHQTTMPSSNGKNVSVVEILFNMQTPVQSDMYNYLIEK